MHHLAFVTVTRKIVKQVANFWFGKNIYNSISVTFVQTLPKDIFLA